MKLKTFKKQVREAIQRLEAREGFDGTLTKQAVIDETQDYYKGAYRLDSLRLFRSASSVLREDYLATKDGKRWIWTQRDAAVGDDWRQSADATGKHCQSIRAGGDVNAGDKHDVAEAVDRGTPWRIALDAIRRARKQRKQRQ